MNVAVFDLTSAPVGAAAIRVPTIVVDHVDDPSCSASGKYIADHIRARNMSSSWANADHFVERWR